MRFRAGVAAVATMIAIISGAASADERFNVCSITINSDDEILTLKKHLPQSQFRFIELTDYARAATADGETSWFGRACGSGVHCDVLVVSGHFGNTWAGNYGTTFAGTSGFSLPLEEMEARRCDQSCPGILADPREVFLFGCKTLTEAGDGETLPSHDVEVFGRHGVPPRTAGRIADEVRNHGEGTSSRQRMEFVFAGVPRVYGFTDVAPAGKRVAPLLDQYLKRVGDYADHLRRLRPVANEALARALEPTCFAQTRGLDPGGEEYSREERMCFLRDERQPLAARVETMERSFEAPDLVSYLPAVDSLLRAHAPVSFDASTAGALDQIRENGKARAEVLALLAELETPSVRLEILRVARSLGWLSAAEALPFQRRIAIQLLHPPIWGESRDLICGMGRETLDRIDLRADEVSPEVYGNEFGIQALGCLRPADARIHERLARSLSDSRDWIATLSAVALKGMEPARLPAERAVASRVAHP